jgi:predicted metal-dependent HD superfamily phosphohydrolase
MGAVTALVERWRAAARGAGATAADDDLDAAGRYLLGRWSEPQRQYHDGTHLTAVLDVVDRFAVLAPHPDRVRLAAWMHDAVYDPRAMGDANERDSAAFAEGLLTTLGVPADVAAEVARLVRLTAGHATAADDPDGELLCDADLAILAADGTRYAKYTAAIRREYAHVPEEAFRAGRAQILRALLELPSIYRLPALHEAWESRARANLAAELAVLSP